MQNSFWPNLEVRCLKLLRVFPFGIMQCYFVIYWLIPAFLYKKKYFLFFTGFIISAIAALYCVAVVTYNRFDFLSVWMGIISYVSRGFPVICLVFIIKMLKTWYIKEQEKDTLLKENLNAELQLLKVQVHPHFLFNTLNNIYFFILSNPLKAKFLVKKLEKILQYMITECEEPLVSLSNEIALINDYLELEKVRYENLDIEIRITGDCTNKMIVPLLMIPFIENSFKHGTSKMLKDPWIKLFIQADEEVLHFILANNKPAEILPDKKHGIGLSNVKKRLAILHPKKHYLTIEPTENTFTINMQIPLEQENKTLKNTGIAIYNL